MESKSAEPAPAKSINATVAEWIEGQRFRKASKQVKQAASELSSACQMHTDWALFRSGFASMCGVTVLYNRRGIPGTAR